ncbi:MAG: hypothetical protein V4539_17540 [Bacteroidota bacterium]
MSKLKAILFLSGVFLVSCFSAIFFEEYFRITVRYLFRLLSGNNISFYGKGFLFPAASFIIAFGLFCTLLSLLALRKKFLRLGLVILVFCLTVIGTSYLDCRLKIAVCTSCKDNKLFLHYTEIDYNFHFIFAFAVVLLFLRITRLKESKKIAIWDFSSASAEEK